MIEAPKQAEIDALTAFSHRWLVQSHKDEGRPLEALIALNYPPEIFTAWDERIKAAFFLGYILAKAGHHGEKDSPTAPD